MTEQILSEHADNLESISLVPSDGARFEVSINGELVFSKLAQKRHPDIKEIRESIKAKLAV